jgi:hypothetical protein
MKMGLGILSNMWLLYILIALIPVTIWFLDDKENQERDDKFIKLKEDVETYAEGTGLFKNIVPKFQGKRTLEYVPEEHDWSTPTFMDHDTSGPFVDELDFEFSKYFLNWRALTSPREQFNASARSQPPSRLIRLNVNDQEFDKWFVFVSAHYKKVIDETVQWYQQYKKRKKFTEIGKAAEQFEV